MTIPGATRARISLLLSFITLACGSALGGIIVGWGNCSYDVCDFTGWSTNVIALSAGFWQSVSLDSSGGVQACGNNVYGSGRGIGGQYIAISSGHEHNLALAADGTVTAWGWNIAGQASVPQGLSGVIAVSAGNYHSLALKSDGTVTAWGGASSTTPQPDGLDNVVAISAGSGFSLALKSDGTVVAWGIQGATNPPPNLTNAVAVAAGSEWAMALCRDGAVVAWGIGPATNVPAGLTAPVAIAAGGAHGLALQADGTIVVWGDNSQGQLWVSGSATNVAMIAAGGYHSVVLAGAGPPNLYVPAVETSFSLGFSVSVSSKSGKVYALEYKDDLSVSNWSGLPLVAGNGAVLTLSDTSPPVSQRFYRIREW